MAEGNNYLTSVPSIGAIPGTPYLIPADACVPKLTTTGILSKSIIILPFPKESRFFYKSLSKNQQNQPPTEAKRKS